MPIVEKGAVSRILGGAVCREGEWAGEKRKGERCAPIVKALDLVMTKNVICGSYSQLFMMNTIPNRCLWRDVLREGRAREQWRLVELASMRNSFAECLAMFSAASAPLLQDDLESIVWR